MLNRKRSSIHIVTVAILAFMTIPIATQAADKIGITMVDIPAGSFIMGSCKNKLTSKQAEENKKSTFLGQPPIWPDTTCLAGSADRNAKDNETPQHRVSIRAFQMGKTEVTVGQFKQFIVAAGRSDLLTDGQFMRFNDTGRGDQKPVVKVNWSDAQDFIAWLNKTDGGGYRLPSEAEWEYACRAGGNNTYCGSNNVEDVAWTRNGKNSSVEYIVGTKKANAFGLYDMSGNTNEWVADWYDENYYRNSPSADPPGADNGKYRLFRGGAVDDDHTYARASSRKYCIPTERRSDVGFRLSRSAQ